MGDLDNRNVNTSPAGDPDVGTAADVEEVMKKYDRESNTRIWTGTPEKIIRLVLMVFSLLMVYMNLFASWDNRVRHCLFLGFIILPVVPLYSKAFPILEQFHFITIGGYFQRNAVSLLGPPIEMAHLGTARQDVVPDYAFLLAFKYSDMHLRLVYKTRADKPCPGIRFQRMVKERIVPSFLRPTVTFSPILYRSPVAKPYGRSSVHTQIRSNQVVDARFALEDD